MGMDNYILQPYSHVPIASILWSEKVNSSSYCALSICLKKFSTYSEHTQPLIIFASLIKKISRLNNMIQLHICHHVTVLAVTMRLVYYLCAHAGASNDDRSYEFVI
jgi:hypothetical protein